MKDVAYLWMAYAAIAAILGSYLSLTGRRLLVARQRRQDAAETARAGEAKR